MQYCFLNQSPTFNQLSNKRAPWDGVRNYQAAKNFYKFLVLHNLIIYKKLHYRKKINKILSLWLLKRFLRNLNAIF